MIYCTFIFDDQHFRLDQLFIMPRQIFCTRKSEQSIEKVANLHRISRLSGNNKHFPVDTAHVRCMASRYGWDKPIPIYTRDPQEFKAELYQHSIESNSENCLAKLENYSSYRLIWPRRTQAMQMHISLPHSTETCIKGMISLGSSDPAKSPNKVIILLWIFAFRAETILAAGPSREWMGWLQWTSIEFRFAVIYAV